MDPTLHSCVPKYWAELIVKLVFIFYFFVKIMYFVVWNCCWELPSIFRAPNLGIFQVHIWLNWGCLGSVVDPLLGESRTRSLAKIKQLTYVCQTNTRACGIFYLLFISLSLSLSLDVGCGTLTPAKEGGSRMVPGRRRWGDKHAAQLLCLGTLVLNRCCPDRFLKEGLSSPSRWMYFKWHQRSHSWKTP